MGPFLTTQALYPLLMKRTTRTVVNVSSAVGSVGMQRAGGLPGLAGKCIAYCSSKAALNMRSPLVRHTPLPRRKVAVYLPLRSCTSQLAGLAVMVRL